MYKINQFIESGKKFQYKAAAPVGYHEIVVVGSLVGITTKEAVKNEIISCDAEGVYALNKKEGETITQGTVVYVKDGKVTATAEGAVKAGVCWENCAAEDATCAVKLG